MSFITVFTPTYNRAFCLSNLYNSLCNQTKKEFRWLIVDDGSTDNTNDLVQSFIQENKISIQYYYQNNSGKHVALMKGLDLCSTELFFCVDSDDTLTSNAIEIIQNNYVYYSNERILGFYYRQIHNDGNNVSTPYPKNVTHIGITDLYHKYEFSGDTAIVLKTEFIKEVRFPVFPNEKFVTERVFYNQLNHIAPMILREEKIYVSEYLTDGYTNNFWKTLARNPYGYAVDCLFEAYYGTRLIYKVKRRAEYDGTCVAFDLNKDYLKEYDNTSWIIKIIAIPFIPHYIKLAKKIKNSIKK